MFKKAAGVFCAAVIALSAVSLTASAAEDHKIKATGKFTKVDGNGTAFVGYNINGYDAYSYKFLAGDKFEYEVYLESNMSGLGMVEIQGSKLKSTDADGVETHDWQYLRMTGIADQEGIDFHPAADLTPVAYKKWYKRILEIPASFAGYTTRHIYLMAQAGEPLPTEEYTFYVKNVKVVGADGKTKLDICSNNKKFIVGQKVESSGVATMKLTAEGGSTATPSAGSKAPAASSPKTSTPAASTPASTTSDPADGESGAPDTSTPSEEDTASEDGETGLSSTGTKSIATAADEGGENGPGMLIGIIIGAVVLLAAAGAAVYFLVIKKKNS